jgi:hypothetical protein
MSHDKDINRRDLLAAGAVAGLLGFTTIESLGAAEKLGGKKRMKFHHIGLPTDKKREKERFTSPTRPTIRSASSGAVFCLTARQTNA